MNKVNYDIHSLQVSYNSNNDNYNDNFIKLFYFRLAAYVKKHGLTKERTK